MTGKAPRSTTSRNPRGGMPGPRVSPPLPGDATPELAGLEMALRAELQTRGPVEELVLRDLVGLEAEHGRILRRIDGILRQRQARELELAVLERGITGSLETARHLGWTWTQGTEAERADIEQQLRTHGIDPETLNAEAWLGVREVIAIEEEALRRIPARRRQLLDDLERLRGRRRPTVPEAEVLGDGH